MMPYKKVWSEKSGERSDFFTQHRASKSWRCLTMLALLSIRVARLEAATTFMNGVVVVEERAGGSLVLPCDVTAPLGDTVAVILWYRDDLPRAIYTYDARNSSLGFQQHTPRDPSLAARANFRPLPPASLTLHPALTTDTGTYQCRADFANSPSRTTVLKAVVVAEVESVTVERLDDNSGVLGEEGVILPDGVLTVRLQRSLFVKCCARGGFPSPRVWWRLNNQSLDTTYAIQELSNQNEASQMKYMERLTCNDLTLVNITRELDQARLQCEASNSNHSRPVVESVVIMVQSPPSSVVLKGVPDALEAERLYKVTCEVSGARPRPLLTWTMTRLKGSSRVLARQDLRKLSQGRLEIRASKADEGAELKCTAVSPAFKEQPMSTATTIRVHYAPIVRIELGALLEAGSVREGTDLYFRCIVDAAPQPYRLDWWYDTHQITNDGNAVSFNKYNLNSSSQKEQSRTRKRNSDILSWTPLRSSDSYTSNIEAKTMGKHSGGSMDTILIHRNNEVNHDKAIVTDIGEFHHIKVNKKNAGGQRKTGTSVVISGDHLVLQRVGKEWSGNYSCSANNVVGDAQSNGIQITVQYPPVCSWSSPRVIRATLGEPLELPCTVLALPSEVTFSWTFSNALSQERITSLTKPNVKSGSLDPAVASSSASLSVLHYRPLTQQDYGTVLCWAENSVGKQVEPCVYSIRPAPEVLSPPPECIISSYAHGSLKIKCVRQRAAINDSLHQDSRRENVPDKTTDLKEGDLGTLENPERVTYTQATRMKSTQKGIIELPHSTNEVKWNIRKENLGTTSNKNSIEEYENRLDNDVLQQTPYVTLENKEKQLQQEVRLDPNKIDGGILSGKESAVEASPSVGDDANREAGYDVKQQASKGLKKEENDAVDTNDRREDKGIMLPFFFVTVREKDTNQLISNETSFDGEFTLTGLTPGQQYSLAVTAVGERGLRSPPLPLTATTLPRTAPPDNQTSRSQPSLDNLQTILCGVISGVIIIVIIIILSITLSRRRNSHHHQQNRRSSSDQYIPAQMETSCSIAKEFSEQRVLCQKSHDAASNDDNSASVATNTTPTSIAGDGDRGCGDDDSSCDGVDECDKTDATNYADTFSIPDMPHSLKSEMQLQGEILLPTSSRSPTDVSCHRQPEITLAKPGVRFADEVSIYDKSCPNQRIINVTSSKFFQKPGNIIFSRVKDADDTTNNSSMSAAKLSPVTIEMAASCISPNSADLVTGTQSLLYVNNQFTQHNNSQISKCNCLLQNKQASSSTHKRDTDNLADIFTGCSKDEQKCHAVCEKEVHPNELQGSYFLCDVNSATKSRNSLARVLPESMEWRTDELSLQGRRKAISKSPSPQSFQYSPKSNLIPDTSCVDKQHHSLQQTSSLQPVHLDRMSTRNCISPQTSTYANGLIEA